MSSHRSLGSATFIHSMLLAAALGISGGAAAQQQAFRDPLDHPAALASHADMRPVMAVAQAGDRLVAVGLRGLVVVSADGGTSWTQATVPVQSDLLAVHFPVPNIGWIVGHDGVVLRSDDGGRSWVKQLDVRSAGVAFRKYYQARAASGDAAATTALKQVERNFKEGTALPYLDVWFENQNKGYAVGSYGLLIATSDGGKTWTPWFDRIDNDQLNLNSVRGINGELMIAGEQGRLYRLDREKERFTATNTGYAGSFFGLAGNAHVTLAFGLRGAVYRSDTKGLEWQEVATPSEASIAAGSVDPSSSRFLLANAAGQVLIGDVDGRHFTVLQPHKHMRLTSLLPRVDGSLVLGGLGGVAVEKILPTVGR
ncbi:MAG: hypothetical protein RJA98_2100 [Pseudomonadota bacterium]|jgi:photosystem II stability/assembly factor-like uncharacterized protein